MEDFEIPDSNVKIEKGIRVIISVTGLHRDPNIYPDPDKFDPERFTKENIAKRSPYVYLPFGDGPRNCIGMLRLDNENLIFLIKNYLIFRVQIRNSPNESSSRFTTIKI